MKHSLPLRAIEKSSVEEQVYRSLRQAILSGQLAETKLVQDNLAASLGVSRIPVRTALKRLEGDHLVAVDERGGYYVRTASISDLREVYAIRTLLEPFATRAAVPLMAPSDLEALRSVLNRMRESADNPDAYVELNMQFHRAIYTVARSPRLIRMIDSIYSGLPPATPKTVPGQLQHSLAEHESILSAVESGDAEAAGDLMAKHIREAGEKLISTLLDESDRRGKDHG